MAFKKILIVDDDKLVRWALNQKCSEFGYQALEAANGQEALDALHSEAVDVVLLDVHLPDLSGIQVLEKLKQAGETHSIIMMTADPQLDEVKAALRLGAYDFVSKPINFDELRVTLQNAVEAGSLRKEVESLRDEVRRRAGYHDVIGVSRKMMELMKFVDKVAASEAATILIQGESGTGKDLVAKVIHYHSSRAQRPFVPVNCSAIPETLMEAELFGHEKGAFTDAKTMKKGLFEVADGGTLFLDEIGELSPLLQAKLLRVLEDQMVRRVGGVRDIQVDVRVIAASNRNLEQEVRENRFRPDLFYRLAIIAIYLPALRDRKEDILPLVEFFLAHYNRKFRKSVRGLSEETSRLVLNYDWPGNVRELKNALERAMILEEGELLKPDDLPFSVAAGSSGSLAADSPRSLATDAVRVPAKRRLPPLSIPEGGTSLEDVERALVELALQQSQDNQIKAAKLLSISRDALRYKIKKFGLSQIQEEPTAPDDPPSPIPELSETPNKRVKTR
jgi:two-component system, NtrC family, response regulator AtoC